MANFLPRYKDQIRITGTPLTHFAGSQDAYLLDRYEAYYRTTQDNNKLYDWDSNYISGMPGQLVANTGTIQPMAVRKPCTRYDLGRVIVQRLSSMMLGAERFPELKVHGDEDAEDCVKALCAASKLPQKLAEARGLGGAMGTVCFSAGFKDGKPSVEVHNAKHCTVLRWEDRSEFKVSSALKAYCYDELVQDGEQLVRKPYWFVRYWDEEREILWEPIPQAIAERPDWSNWPHEVIETKNGFCPFYWVQNQPNTEDEYGESDYEGSLDLFDELNRLLSATTKGTRSSVDPTLVVHENPMNNPGKMKTGSDNTIFAEKGAAYLEVNGASQKAAEAQIELLKQFALDSAGVVLADPRTMAGAAQSAAALRLLYAPTLAKCDTLREQYETYALKPILVGLVRMMKNISKRGPESQIGPNGENILVRTTIDLPLRVIHDGDTTRFEKRNPGTSEDVDVKWQPYFPATWTDIQTAIQAAKMANGERAILSQRSSIALVAALTQVQSVEEELARIREDEEYFAGVAAAAMEDEAAIAAKYSGDNPIGDPLGDADIRVQWASIKREGG